MITVSSNRHATKLSKDPGIEIHTDMQLRSSPIGVSVFTEVLAFYSGSSDIGTMQAGNKKIIILV